MGAGGPPWSYHDAGRTRMPTDPMTGKPLGNTDVVLNEIHEELRKIAVSLSELVRILAKIESKQPR
jgi:hypothetical protein